MKLFIKYIISAFGLEIMRKDDPRLKYLEYDTTFKKLLETNFKNLIHGYQLIFTKDSNFPELISDETRESILMRVRGTPPTEAFFIIDGLNRTREVPGDVCEFGVAQGETSALIANEIRNGVKNFYLYDSFEGLPKPTEKDLLKDDIFGLGSMDAYTGTMASPETMVRNRLKDIAFDQSRIVIHKGFVTSDFASLNRLPEKVSFAYVDFDFYEPILITLEALDKRLSAGAVVVVDDYDFFSTGAKTAVDEFIQKHPEYSLHIPDKRLGCFCVISK